ncbi:putative DDRGK domain [Paratrimastix pyriformis]|uniref:DDRGK domain n=1 Tax=Paratrimastix pyriformis TaxID=342808 RepID=A0ABQ8UM71_9EUKA|nr:putative DDRGK domain [Paratrimastix pyriformis]
MIGLVILSFFSALVFICLYVGISVYKKAKAIKTIQDNAPPIAPIPRDPVPMAVPPPARPPPPPERARAPVEEEESSGDEPSDGDDSEQEPAAPGQDVGNKLKPVKKVGKKKQEKLARKEEKARQREAFVQMLEQRKKEEEERREQDRLADEARIAEEKRQEEERQKAIEAERAREQAEYERVKGTIQEIAEGTDGDEGAQQQTLQDFLGYLKEKRFVSIEDLALRFAMPAQICVDRLQSLLKEGTLTGVLDERGRFVYLSPAQLEKVAESHGRVAIRDLTAYCNGLLAAIPAPDPAAAAAPPAAPSTGPSGSS